MAIFIPTKPAYHSYQTCAQAALAAWTKLLAEADDKVRLLKEEAARKSADAATAAPRQAEAEAEEAAACWPLGVQPEGSVALSEEAGGGGQQQSAATVTGTGRERPSVEEAAGGEEQQSIEAVATTMSFITLRGQWAARRSLARSLSSGRAARSDPAAAAAPWLVPEGEEVHSGDAYSALTPPSSLLPSPSSAAASPRLLESNMSWSRWKRLRQGRWGLTSPPGTQDEEGDSSANGVCPSDGQPPSGYDCKADGSVCFWASSEALLGLGLKEPPQEARMRPSSVSGSIP